MPYFVGVHTGAGKSSEETSECFRTLCKQACRKASQLLASGYSSLDAAIAAARILENCVLTNAGVGSSIAKDGSVLTEASLVSPGTGFYAAGCLRNIKNPVEIVHFMSQVQHREENYITPRVLVGDGAIKFVKEYGGNIAITSNLQTKRSLCQFKSAQKYFDKEQSVNKRAKFEDNGMAKSHEGIEDTIGVICLDGKGEISCVTSSGGSVYKHPGRLGQCCVHGAGVYVNKTAGIVTTGNGEEIIQCMLGVVVMQDRVDKDRLLGSVLEKHYSPMSSSSLGRH